MVLAYWCSSIKISGTVIWDCCGEIAAGGRQWNSSYKEAVTVGENPISLQPLGTESGEKPAEAQICEPSENWLYEEEGRV